MNEKLAAGYDSEYLRGKYRAYPPTPFVATIIDELQQRPPQGPGLYVGCGNGRNFMPLIEGGLELRGMDLSEVAIGQLKTKLHAKGRDDVVATTGDFAEYGGLKDLDYIIAIHAFQHGNRSEVEPLFARSRQALMPGGRLFLQVNSVHSTLSFRRRRVEGDQREGFTIRYLEGLKEGHLKHFYSSQELGHLALQHGFDVMLPPYETEAAKQDQTPSRWKQWETIWQRVE